MPGSTLNRPRVFNIWFLFTMVKIYEILVTLKINFLLYKILWQTFLISSDHHHCMRGQTIWSLRGGGHFCWAAVFLPCCTACKIIFIQNTSRNFFVTGDVFRSPVAAGFFILQELGCRKFFFQKGPSHPPPSQRSNGCPPTYQALSYQIQFSWFHFMQVEHFQVVFFKIVSDEIRNHWL